MSLHAPAEGWYSKKVASDEKWWVALAATVCLITFFWMVIWHVYGKQNPGHQTYKIKEAEFMQLSEAFNKKHQIGEENGIPVVAPPSNGDVFLTAQMWRWSSIPVLVKNEWYTFHLSSADVCHGFSVQPINMNFIVLPGYDYVLRFKPNAAGDYKMFCNEFCGIGHQTMIGKIIVVETQEEIQNLKLTQPKNP